MVRVTVMTGGERDEAVGDFDFEQLPRAGDEIRIPSGGPAGSIRIFTVGQVVHVAAWAGVGPGSGACTQLRFCEEIG